MANHDAEREAFLTEFIHNEWGSCDEPSHCDADDPELRALVAGTFSFQIAWANHLARSDLTGTLRARVQALSEKVAERRDAALRRYWRS